MDGAAAGCALFVGSFVRIFGGELLADSTTIFTATEKLLLELAGPYNCQATTKCLRMLLSETFLCLLTTSCYLKKVSYGFMLLKMH